MQDKLGGGVDLFEGVMFVGEVVGELEFEPSNDAVPEVGLETTNKCSTLLGFRDAILIAEELCDCSKGAVVLSEIVERTDAELESVANELIHGCDCPFSLIF